jgi:hypothetical protein
MCEYNDCAVMEFGSWEGIEDDSEIVSANEEESSLLSAD